MHLKICTALLLMMPAAFASSVDLKTQLQSCQQISDEEQRLSCFDQIVSQLNTTTADISKVVATHSAVTTTPAPVLSNGAVATPTAAPVVPDMTREFGLKKSDPVEEIENIVALVQSAILDKRKKLLITLENGQQWQQIDQGYLRIKAGDRCTVQRGAIGSFLLGVDGITKKIRVRRVE